MKNVTTGVDGIADNAVCAVVTSLPLEKPVSNWMTAVPKGLAQE